MKSLTFDEIYQDLKSLEYDYLQPTLDRILAEEPRYIENFNKVFANLTDNAYLELKKLFMEFGLDFIDFNKEIQAKKKKHSTYIQIYEKWLYTSTTYRFSDIYCT